MKNRPENLTATQRVLWELRRLRLYNVKIFLSRNPYARDNIISGGFAPVEHFQSPSIGGSDAGRQIRYLRGSRFHQNGHEVPIISKSHTYIAGDGKPRTRTIYRLDMTREEIRHYDWSEAWAVPFTWIFDREQYQTIKRRLNPPLEVNFDTNGQVAFL